MPNSTVTYRSAQPAALLSVTGVGQQTVRSLIEDRALPVFAAVYVESGSGTLETPLNGVLACEAPALLWLIPGLVHTYGPDPGTAWRERWVLFQGRLAHEFVTRQLIDALRPILSLSPRSEVPSLFHELHSELMLASALGDSAAAATVHRLVTRSAVERAQNQPRTGRTDFEMVAALRERALSTIDLDAFAREFGISTPTLRRRIVAATGMPPKVLQLRTRIDRAKELLALTDRSIEQVAAAVGLEDSFYFARLFLHREKLSPTEFRRLNYRR